jgi:hypothetical protein
MLPTSPPRGRCEATVDVRSIPHEWHSAPNARSVFAALSTQGGSVRVGGLVPLR